MTATTDTRQRVKISFRNDVTVLLNRLGAAYGRYHRATASRAQDRNLHVICLLQVRIQNLVWTRERTR